jgi:hypothetical protein
MSNYELLHVIRGRQGFSIFENGDEPTSGYMVSIPGNKVAFRLNIDESMILYKLKNTRRIATALSPAAAGGWYHNGWYYLDVSLQVVSLDFALWLAKTWHQLAIWDVVNQCEIKVT